MDAPTASRPPRRPPSPRRAAPASAVTRDRGPSPSPPPAAAAAAADDDEAAARVPPFRHGAFAVARSPTAGWGAFAVARSPTAGWGAFAARALRRGDVILRERPLLVADRASLFAEFAKLPPAARELALSLHANELAKPGTPPILAVWATNCFTVGGPDAGLFPVAARFNHACCPAHNVDFRFDRDSGRLELVVRAPHVAAGEELRISYGRDRTAAELYMTYGFRCRCGACRGLGDGDVRRLTSQW